MIAYYRTLGSGTLLQDTGLWYSTRGHWAVVLYYRTPNYGALLEDNELTYPTRGDRAVDCGTL
ncbi:MAG TPA: hypothetical protein PK300_06110, partial [Bacillota bacterium]|nr:hypothetical protein [Bacillota bacterium]